MPRRHHRRRVSLTSLIDVIFLLLLFFMLSSTFTRFSEVTLASGGAGGGAPPQNPVFVSLAPTSLHLNGTRTTFADLHPALDAYRAGSDALALLVAPAPEVTAQRLTDLLVVLGSVPDLNVTVLDAS